MSCNVDAVTIRKKTDRLEKHMANIDKTISEICRLQERILEIINEEAIKIYMAKEDET